MTSTRPAGAAAQVEENGHHCLVVDDEAPLRNVLARVMRADGFSCDEAENGREAMAALENRPAELVLSDLYMPEMDGIALLRHIRANHPDTAVMMVTAASDVRTAVDCLSEGALDYLTKPFQIEEVRARARQALDKRRLILENREYRERLEERVAEQARHIEQIFMAAIQSLADVLEVKDPYTRGHSARVSRYSALIAKELGMGGDFVAEVELGGHVHDLGKIGVRESILNKPGPLSRMEYSHIMTHPVVGWRILSPLLSDHGRALAVVRHHHERWDGRGLPDGLQREEIPIEARIAAVADSFDAMTSERPYRPSASVDETIAELRRCRATQLDPDAVDALVTVLSRE